MHTDDFDLDYCSCGVEGRDIEMDENCNYICMICKKQIFIQNQFKSRRNILHKTTKHREESVLNHGLNENNGGL